MSIKQIFLKAFTTRKLSLLLKLILFFFTSHFTPAQERKRLTEVELFCNGSSDNSFYLPVIAEIIGK